MTTIYTVNIGANTGHSSMARSPIFADDSFVYVPFCDNKSHLREPYSAACQHYINPQHKLKAHPDPDWDGFTYGDICRNRRAAALQHVKPGDVLLFWGLLTKHSGRNDWAGFERDHGWYLLGAFRILDCLDEGQGAATVSAALRKRAMRNIHLKSGTIADGERLFIGDPRHSTLFRRAVDLGVNKNNGLVYSTMRSAEGKRLSRTGKPRWYSSLRSCRAMWDLRNADQAKRAKQVRDVIQKANSSFDLLKGLE